MNNVSLTSDAKYFNADNTDKLTSRNGREFGYINLSWLFIMSLFERHLVSRPPTAIPVLLNNVMNLAKRGQEV